MPDVVTGCATAGLDDVPVVVGGIIPDADARPAARRTASRAVFTPKDFGITDIIGQIVEEIRPRQRSRAADNNLTTLDGTDRYTGDRWGTSGSRPVPHPRWLRTP